MLTTLYIVKKKSENFSNEKNVKMIKRSRSYGGYANAYNVEILIYFNPELQVRELSVQ